MRLLWRRLVLLFVALVTLLVPAATFFLPASADATGWFSGVGASAVKEGDISVDETFTNRDCTNVTLPVVSYYTDWTTHVVKSNQSMCMVSTLNGLIDKNGSVIQPYGFDEAHAIANSLPGNGVIRAIPNQDGVVYFSNSPYFGALSLNIYRNFYTHLHYNLFRQSFDLSDAPDFPVKFADGKSMPVNPISLATSPNGRYIVADVVGTGYVRIDMATLEVKPFAVSNGYDQFGNPLGSSITIDNSGRYAALSFAPNGTQDSLKIVDIDLCTTAELPATIGGKVNVSCPTRDILPAIGGGMTGMRSIPSMRFINEHVLEVDSRDGANHYARYAIVASGTQKSTANYLAMGDSFIAGEGAWSYRTGTDTDLNKCHQSALSYPYLLSGQFTSFASVACSGARLRNMTGDNDKPKTAQLKNDLIPTKEMQNAALEDKTPGYIRQLDFIGAENPDVITLSIVGNDIGFKDILVRCVAPFAGDITPNSNCYEWYEDRLELVNSINARFNELVSLYTNLKATNRKVYIIGYPQIVSETGSCGLNVRLGESERQFANQLISYLDSVVKRAADKAGVFYVDTEAAFDGHKLCEGKDVAVNGLVKGDDALLILGNESYHPNQRGYQLLADTIAAKTHNFTELMPAPNSTLQNPAAEENLPILQAPKQPRAINQTLQDDDVLQRITRGQSGGFDVTGYGGYLAPNSTGTVTLHSTPTDLGAVSVDANGEIHTQLAIPAAVTPGFHTLHFYVKNIAGQSVDIQKTVYVAASNEDSDGDGSPNGVDSCANIPNSGVDEDGDGTDDACDAEIKAATPPPEPSDPGSGGTATPPNLVVAPGAPLTPSSIITVPKIPMPLLAIISVQNAVGKSGTYVSTDLHTGVVAGSHTIKKASAELTENHSRPWTIWLMALLGLLVASGVGLRVWQKARTR